MKPIRITNYETIINDQIHWNGLSFDITDFRENSDIGYKGHLSHQGHLSHSGNGNYIGLFFHIDFSENTIDMEWSYLFGKSGSPTISTTNPIKVKELIMKRDLMNAQNFKSKLLHMIELLYTEDMEFKKWCISLDDFVPF
jgi:hypothetical protein